MATEPDSDEPASTERTQAGNELVPYQPEQNFNAYRRRGRRELAKEALDRWAREQASHNAISAIASYAGDAAVTGLIGAAATKTLAETDDHIMGPMLRGIMPESLRRQAPDRYIAISQATAAINKNFGTTIVGLPEAETVLQDGSWQFCFHRDDAEYHVTIGATRKVLLQAPHRV
jgi:hypothetical protein